MSSPRQQIANLLGFDPPEEDGDEFQHRFCRIATTFFREGQFTKHNAQTACDSLRELFKYLRSICPEVTTVFQFSDGSTKGFTCAPSLAGLTSLAKELSTDEKPFRIVQMFHAPYHGSSPCDADQQVVKQLNNKLGPQADTYDQSLRTLVDFLSSDVG